MEGYCVKCRTKREIQNPEFGKTKKNVDMTKGKCPTCGTNITVFGTPKNA